MFLKVKKSKNKKSFLNFQKHVQTWMVYEFFFKFFKKAIQKNIHIIINNVSSSAIYINQTKIGSIYVFYKKLFNLIFKKFSFNSVFSYFYKYIIYIIYIIYVYIYNKIYIQK